MTAQVKFFPIKYCPGPREREKLQKLQDSITLAHQNIFTASKTRYEEIARKQALYQRIRDKWNLIDGG